MPSVYNISYGPKAWRALNGIFCVYKPSGLSCKNVRQTLQFNLCRDLNELQPREVREMVSLEGSVCTKQPYEVKLVPNFADHPLVSGPRYQEQDVRLAVITKLGWHTSGVLLMTVNDGCKHAGNPLYKSLLRKYEIKGQFGLASKTFMSDGIIYERSTYRHIKAGSLEKMLSAIQATHQSLAYKFSGIPLDSQAAYEVASAGMVKPDVQSDPLIYSIKCTEFQLPYFTLEVHCINETEEFLAELVHDIGIDLKSTAVCTQLRQVQYGHFTLPHALLRKHWTLEHILNNLSLCGDVLKQNLSSVDGRSIRAAKLRSLHIEKMQSQMREDCLEV